MVKKSSFRWVDLAVFGGLTLVSLLILIYALVTKIETNAKEGLYLLGLVTAVFAGIYLRVRLSRKKS